MFRTVLRVGAVCGLLIVGGGPIGSAEAYTAAPGWAVSPFATGFSSSKGLGPIGVAFDGGGRLYVSGGGNLYRFNAGGGPADSAHRVNRGSLGGTPSGLAFGKDGSLFAALRTGFGRGAIVELNQSTGAVVRWIAQALPCPTGLAVDPRSGDIFVSTVGCQDGVLRITGTRVRPYVTGIKADGIAFGQDGTLYAAHLPDAAGNTVSAIAGTASATPGARTGLASVPESDGIAVSEARGNAGPAFLVVNRRDGAISTLDLASGTVSDLVTAGSRGDFVAAGPDGCLYATQSTEVVKVAGGDGTCSTGAGALQPTGVRIAPPASSFVQLSGASAKAPSCRTNRRLKVRFRAPGGVKVGRARIFVKGHYNRTVSGRALRRSVTVRKLPAGRFRLTIRARTKSGRNIVVHRRYGACAGR